MEKKKQKKQKKTLSIFIIFFLFFILIFLLFIAYDYFSYVHLCFQIMDTSILDAENKGVLHSRRRPRRRSSPPCEAHSGYEQLQGSVPAVPAWQLERRRCECHEAAGFEKSCLVSQDIRESVGLHSLV